MGDPETAASPKVPPSEGKILSCPDRRESRQTGTGGPSLPVYLTVKQACKVAGIGRTTFYKLLDDARSGLAELVLRVPGLGHIRIPEREFLRWLESSRKKRAGRKTKNPT